MWCVCLHRSEAGEEWSQMYHQEDVTTSSDSQGQVDDEGDSPDAAVFVIVPLCLPAAHLITQMAH